MLDNILRLLDSSQLETLSFLSISLFLSLGRLDRTLFCENFLYKTGEISEIVRFELAKFLPNSFFSCYFKRHRAVFSSKIKNACVR